MAHLTHRSSKTESRTEGLEQGAKRMGPVRKADSDAEFGVRYREVLRDYFQTRHEAALHDAYELGREALERGMGLLEFVNMHRAQLHELLEAKQPIERRGLPASAARFLVECLGPFEMLQIERAEASDAVNRLNRFLEEESRRIAQLLHDESAQLLASTYLELAGIEREHPDSRMAERVDSIRNNLDQVQEQLRHISHELSPQVLERLGLMEALNYLADGICERNGLGLHIRCECDPKMRYATSVETAVYRSVQEALNNVVRHANAREVTVTLGLEANTLICTVEDDGRGFGYLTLDEAIRSGGLGLSGIRARIEGVNGSLQLISAPEAGATLRIVIPLVEEML